MIRGTTLVFKAMGIGEVTQRTAVKAIRAITPKTSKAPSAGGQSFNSVGVMRTGNTAWPSGSAGHQKISGLLSRLGFNAKAVRPITRPTAKFAPKTKPLSPEVQSIVDKAKALRDTGDWENAGKLMRNR